VDPVLSGEGNSDERSRPLHGGRESSIPVPLTYRVTTATGGIIVARAGSGGPLSAA
jgi:hypothetical protein